jgi:hypothetical protein
MITSTPLSIWVMMNNEQHRLFELFVNNDTTYTCAKSEGGKMENEICKKLLMDPN